MPRAAATLAAAFVALRDVRPAAAASHRPAAARRLGPRGHPPKSRGISAIPWASSPGPSERFHASTRVGLQNGERARASPSGDDGRRIAPFAGAPGRRREAALKRSTLDETGRDRDGGDRLARRRCAATPEFGPDWQLRFQVQFLFPRYGSKPMVDKVSSAAICALFGFLVGASAHASSVTGRVLGSGAPIAHSKVTLWAASDGEPKELARARTDADGRFTLNATAPKGSLYLIAQPPEGAAWPATSSSAVNSSLTRAARSAGRAPLRARPVPHMDPSPRARGRQARLVRATCAGSKWREPHLIEGVHPRAPSWHLSAMRACDAAGHGVARASNGAEGPCSVHAAGEAELPACLRALARAVLHLEGVGERPAAGPDAAEELRLDDARG